MEIFYKCDYFIMQLEEAGLETEEDEDMESKGIDLR